MTESVRAVSLMAAGEGGRVNAVTNSLSGLGRFPYACSAVTLSSSSSDLRPTQALTLLLRQEAVLVAAAAAVPEASALLLCGVKEPHHRVVVAAALVLREDTGIWRTTGDGY